jgi:DNA-binding transcriptional regulator YhcF (GntR family)
MARNPRPQERDGQLYSMLRARVIAGIHSGQYDVGHRLPTYREIASEVGVDLRAVARAYAVLEREGLVEVRGRSGVFVAPQESIGGTVLAETSRWLSAVLREARLRRIPVPQFPDFVRQCTQSTLVRCVCFDETEDQVSALCEELTEEFGLHATGALVRSLAAPSGGAQGRRMPATVRKADFLVTSLYHMGAVAPLAEQWGMPLVVIRLCPDAVHRLHDWLRHHELPVIHVDPAFPDRIRAILNGDGQRIRPVSARDRRAVAALDREQPVMISPAARQRLGDVPLPPSFIHGGFISNDSAAELIDLLIRFNLEAMTAGSNGADYAAMRQQSTQQ